MRSWLTRLLVRFWSAALLRIVLIGVVLLYALLDLWGLSLFHGQVDYVRFGDVGEWFQGTAQLSAVIAAAIAIRNDRLGAERSRAMTISNREEDLRLHEMRERERIQTRAQAVFVWAVPIQDPITLRMSRWIIAIANETGVPVYEWFTNLRESGTPIANSISHGPLLPGTHRLDIQDGTASPKHLPDASALVIEFVGFTSERYRRSGPAVEVIN